MTDALIEGPAPARPLATRGWHALDTAREQRFTGALVLDVGETVQLFFDRGELYVAERMSDPELADRLLALEVVTAAELDAGLVRVGAVRHLGRLFDRVPTIDRDAVLAAIELMNAEVASSIASVEVRGAEAMPYQHHPTGVLRWFSGSPDEADAPVDTAVGTAIDTAADIVSPPPSPPAPAFAPPSGSPLPPPMAAPVSSGDAPPDPPIVAPAADAVPVTAPEPDPASDRRRYAASDAVISWEQPSWLDGTVRSDAAPDAFDGSAAAAQPADSGLGISSDWTSSLGIELPRRTPKASRAEPAPTEPAPTEPVATEPSRAEMSGPQPSGPPAVGSPPPSIPTNGGERTDGPQSDEPGPDGTDPTPDPLLMPAIEVVWPSGDVEARTADVASAARSATGETTGPASGSTARLAAGRPPAKPVEPTTDDDGDLASVIEIDWSVGTRVVPVEAAEPLGQAVVDDVLSAVRDTVAACEERVAESRPGRIGSVASLAGLGGVVQPAAGASVFDDASSHDLTAADAVPELSPEDRSGALRRLIGSLRRP